MPDEYEKALTHVAYEYAALESAYNLARTATKTPQLIAAIDSFLVHYRSLAEFFHSDKDWKIRFPQDDIRAEHYVSRWKTPTLNEWTKWQPKIHILLAHLSTKRNAASGSDHRVDFEPMMKEMRAAWSTFAQGLTGTIHDEKLDPLLKHHRDNFTRIS